MPQYKVQTGDSLSQIAAQHQVSMNAIQARNPIISNADHIETGWSLDIPKPSVKAKSALASPKSANDTSTGEVEIAACELEYVALLQLTDEADTVYALTQTQLNDIEAEVATLQAPLKALKKAEGGPDDQIPAAREQAWKSLKELRALPEPEKGSTAKELLAEYEGKWARAQKRLAHQKRRQGRIKDEIELIDRQILFRARPSSFRGSRDRLSLKVFETLSEELKKSLPAVESLVETREKAEAEQHQAVGSMKKRLKILRAALEAEISYRVTKNVASNGASPEVEQLRIESECLKEATLWPNYISQPDINELVKKQEKLNALNDGLRLYMDHASDFLSKVDVAFMVWDYFTPESAEAREKRLEEREKLVLEQAALFERLVQTSPSGTVDMVAKPQTQAMKSRTIVEIKHTGAGGFRYVRRERLTQLLQNLRRLKMADISSAMQSGDGQAVKNALKEATEGLKTNRTLKVKLAEVKTDKDNFFNQLEVELFKGQAQTDGGRFAADAEAQMFRFAAQAGLEASYDPVKGEGYIGGKVEGAYSLLQGEASFSAKLPNTKGFELKLEYVDGEGQTIELFCGLLRADAEYKIQGFAGACASLSAHARISSNPGHVGISGETNGEAFAGASLSNEASFGVKWKAAYASVMERQSAGKNTESLSESQLKIDDVFKSLLDVKPELAISAGFGAGFEFQVTLIDGNLYLYLKASVVIGVGGGGGVAAEMSGGQVWELAKFIRWSLEHSDFRFLDWIDSEAYEFMSFFLKVFSISSGDFENVFNQGFGEIEEAWDQLTTADTRVRDVAKKVLNNNNFQLLTPLVKASLLTVLMEDSAPLFGFSDPYEEVSAEACIKIFLITHKSQPSLAAYRA